MFDIALLYSLIVSEISTVMSGKVIIDSALRAAVHLRSSKLPSEVAKSSAALLSSLSGSKHTLPDLSYDYNALERKFLCLPDELE